VIFCAAYRRPFTLALGRMRGMRPDRTYNDDACLRVKRVAAGRVRPLVWTLRRAARCGRRARRGGGRGREGAAAISGGRRLRPPRAARAAGPAADGQHNPPSPPIRRAPSRKVGGKAGKKMASLLSVGMRTFETINTKKYDLDMFFDAANLLRLEVGGRSDRR
jgi:hypothetical protein